MMLLLGEIPLAQAISHTANHFSVTWSVVCQSVVCHTSQITRDQWNYE